MVSKMIRINKENWKKLEILTVLKANANLSIRFLKESKKAQVLINSATETGKLMLSCLEVQEDCTINFDATQLLGCIEILETEVFLDFNGSMVTLSNPEKTEVFSIPVIEKTPHLMQFEGNCFQISLEGKELQKLSTALRTIDANTAYFFQGDNQLQVFGINEKRTCILQYDIGECSNTLEKNTTIFISPKILQYLKEDAVLSIFKNGYRIAGKDVCFEGPLPTDSVMFPIKDIEENFHANNTVVVDSAELIKNMEKLNRLIQLKKMDQSKSYLTVTNSKKKKFIEIFSCDKSKFLIPVIGIEDSTKNFSFFFSKELMKRATLLSPYNMIMFGNNMAYIKSFSEEEGELVPDKTQVWIAGIQPQQ